MANYKILISDRTKYIIRITYMTSADVEREATDLIMSLTPAVSAPKINVLTNLVNSWQECLNGYIAARIEKAQTPISNEFNDDFFDRAIVKDALKILECASLTFAPVGRDPKHVYSLSDWIAPSVMSFKPDAPTPPPVPPAPFVPTVTWGELESKIVGHAAAKKAIKFAVDSADKNAELLSKFGRSTPRGMLLYGPPGTGKTMLARLAWEYMASKRPPAPPKKPKEKKYDFFGREQRDDIPETKTAGDGFFLLENVKDMWYGNTEKRIAQAFNDAREWAKKNKAKAVLFVDEADELLGARDGKKTVDLVPCFLAEMDNVDKSLTEFNPYVILATNRLDALDPAIIRAGRIDSRVKVDLPTEEDTRALFALYFGSAPFQAGYSVEQATDDAVKFVNTKAILPVKAIILSIVTAEQGSALEPYLKDLTLQGKLTGATICGLVDKAKTHALERIIAEHEDESVGGIRKDDVLAGLNELVEELRQAPLDSFLQAEMARVAQEVQKGVIKAAEQGAPSKNDLAAMSLMRDTKGGLN